jgi:hypothetical protein
VTNDKLATLAHISQIKEDHLEIENLAQNLIILNALRYYPVILATAAHQIVLQTSDILQKGKPQFNTHKIIG